MNDALKFWGWLALGTFLVWSIVVALGHVKFCK